jgi:hypothetical protein
MNDQDQLLGTPFRFADLAFGPISPGDLVQFRRASTAVRQRFISEIDTKSGGEAALAG